MSTTTGEALVGVCDTTDVPLGEGRAVNVGGLRVAVFHTGAGWYALDDRCPHRGGPLSDGILADSCVACPLHDRRFDLASGAALTDGAPVRAHRVVVRGERVLVEPAARSGWCAVPDRSVPPGGGGDRLEPGELSGQGI